jgi:ppGpp synthetase/RelA/SpoT-type nucleotidyltranferase
VPRSSSTTEVKVKLLIREHFPWNAPGYPGRPPGGAQADLEQLVARWIEQQTLPFGSAALALAARIKPILHEIESRVLPRRLIARLDCSSHVKSPASVLEKMVRDWDPNQQRHPALGFRNFTEDMTDLGRIRVVANFLSDAEIIADTLEEPYATPIKGLTTAQLVLRNEYSLKENHLLDSMHLEPAKRKAGERCRKGIFRPLGLQQRLMVEVQVQTLLQEAWDKKDHFLVYEPRRRGEVVEVRHQSEMFAMSELLYVADLTFDRLRAAIEGGGGTHTKRGGGRRASTGGRGATA